MKARRWITVVGISLLAALALAVVLLRESTGSTSANTFQTFIDANSTNGYCNLPPDSTRNVTHPTNFNVAVCVEDPTTALGVFSLELVYDDTIVKAPEVANLAPALDDNPNANQAALGTGWDCSGYGFSFPTGDTDAATGAGHGRAKIGCLSLTGPWTFTSTGYIALVNFDTQGIGATSGLALQNVVLGNRGDEGEEIGSCNPTIGIAMPCVDGSVTVTGGSPTPTPTRTPTPTLTPTITPTPTVTPTPPPFDCLFEDDYGWGTSLGIKARNWTFMGPGAFKAPGVGVTHIRNRVIVSGKSGSVRVFGVGMCPNGPARATAVDMSFQRFGVLRLSDITP